MGASIPNDTTPSTTKTTTWMAMGASVPNTAAGGGGHAHKKVGQTPLFSKLQGLT